MPAISTGRILRPRAECELFVATKLGEVINNETGDAWRSQMLDEYLRRRLLLADAERAGLTVAEVEIEQAAQENPQLRAMAANSGSREEMRRDLLIDKYYRQMVLRDVHVTPEEAQRYIEQNQARLTDRPGFLVREIRVQTRAEAEALRRELTEGKRDFAAVARLHSDAPNAEAGGLSRYDEGQLPDVLEKAMQPLRPGDISQVDLPDGTRSGLVDAIINQDPGHEARSAARILLAYSVGDPIIPDQERIRIEIFLRDNLP